MGSVKKLFLAVAMPAAIASVLSACALLPVGPGVYLDGDNAQADAQMETIAAAVKDLDPAALKALFTKRALDEAVDLDAGLDYFLSFFPDGEFTWKRDAIGSEAETDGFGATTEMLRANYRLTIDGEDYRLFFADFTVNDLVDPDNVGIYAMGLTPWTGDNVTGGSKAFSEWAGAIHYDGTHAKGYPGVYVPAG
jgi:hypothetical protein